MFETEIKTTETGIEYYDTLPTDYIKLERYKDIFTLMPGETVLTSATANLREGLVLILYNPQTKQYYPRYITYGSNRMNLYNFWKDGNLYIKETDVKK